MLTRLWSWCIWIILRNWNGVTAINQTTLEWGREVMNLSELPEATFGLRVLSLPASVCVFVCQSRGCRCDAVAEPQLKSHKFACDSSILPFRFPMPITYLWTCLTKFCYSKWFSIICAFLIYPYLFFVGLLLKYTALIQATSLQWRHDERDDVTGLCEGNSPVIVRGIP